MDRRVISTAVLVFVAVSGCASGSAEDPPSWAAPSATAGPTVTVVTGSGAPSGLPEDPQTAVPPGVAAAEVDSPRAVDGADYLDLSDQAKQNFAAWVAYEIWETSYSHGPEQDLTAGISACVWRNKAITVDRVVELLSSEMGYQRAGAAAVLRGSLEALCPSFNLGYRTYFDKQVDQFAQAVAARITFAPPPPVFYEYGLFMKAVCHAYDDPAIGRSGLRGWVRAQTDSNALTLARPHAADEALAILVEQATLVGCINHVS